MSSAPVPHHAVESTAEGNAESTAGPARLPLLSLLPLSAAVFLTVTSELLPTGLLLEMSRDLDVSESRVGLLVSVFALSVVATAAPLSIVTRRLPRKPLLLALLGVFALSSVLAATAPTYEVLLLSRVLGGVANGMLWTVATPYAARLAPEGRVTRAIAVVTIGGSLAAVAGVPLVTLLGQSVGWRWAFASTAVALAVVALLVVLRLPPLAAVDAPRTRRGLDPTLPRVVAVSVSVLLVVVAYTSFSTYISPWITGVADLPETAVGGILALVGVGGVIGLAVVGAVGDRRPRVVAPLLVAGMATGVGVLGLAPGSLPVVLAGIAVWAISFGGLPTLLNSRMVDEASPRMKDLGAALFTTSFNIGIAGGAALGGAVLDASGPAALPAAVVIVALLALAVLLGITLLLTRAPRTTRTSSKALAP